MGDTMSFSISTGGNVSVVPYEDDIVRGKIPGKESFEKFGRLVSTQTTIEDVWFTGGTRLYITTGEQLKVLSGDVADTSAGTGARTVHIFGITDALVLQDEVVTMNGTTAVTTAGTYKDIYRMKVITSGTALSNVGTISIKNNAQTATFASIAPLGFGQTLETHYTVPTGKQLLIKQIAVSVSGTKDVTVMLFVRPLNESWQVKFTGTFDNSNEIEPTELLVAAGSDVVMRSLASGLGARINTSYSGILESA